VSVGVGEVDLTDQAHLTEHRGPISRRHTSVNGGTGRRDTAPASAAGADELHGWKTTFTAPSCFFWNIA
jgi:hypothetical protein